MTALFTPVPGAGSRMNIAAMLRYGHQLRDYHVWQYPLLPGALTTFQMIAAGRETKMSATTAAAAQRAMDWVNEAVTYNLDGTVEYGFESFIKRIVPDYLCIGRTMFTDYNDKLQYLDPTYVHFQFSDKPKWVHSYTMEQFRPDQIFIHHPIPIGGSGYFMAPIAPVIPTAMLAWLIREHDSASADGRKLRDIIIVGSQHLGDALQAGIQKSLALWAGSDPRENGIPIVYLESLPQGQKTEDYVTRLGIANIPDKLDRDRFDFNFANEISANTGLALRHFYNSERATNRALEEVQDTRQQLKGPQTFSRSHERLINDSGVLKRRFGRQTRMSFIEETDLQSQTVRATVLQGYASALQTYATVFNAAVNGEAFLAWLQSENILPADLDLITDIGAMVKSDTQPTDDTRTVEGHPEASGLASGAAKEKVFDDLDYDEVSVDRNGRVIDRRRHLVSMTKIIEKDLLKDEEFVESVEKAHKPIDFNEILAEARKNNFDEFRRFSTENIEKTIEIHPEFAELAEIRSKKLDELTDDQHRWITQFLREAG